MNPLHAALQVDREAVAVSWAGPRPGGPNLRLRLGCGSLLVLPRVAHPCPLNHEDF